MLLHLLPTICLCANFTTAAQPHETQQLLEQYDQNAQRCQEIACVNEELDGLDGELLLLLGRRAAVLRQRSRIIAEAKLKGRTLRRHEAAARLAWLAQKGRELGVPSVLSGPVMQALLRATEAYEAQQLPQPQ